MTQTETTQTQTLLGYRVERNQDGNGEKLTSPAYFLRGPRGAYYGLIRSHREPRMMFAINLRKFGHVEPQGVKWFTDINGKLEAV